MNKIVAIEVLKVQLASWTLCKYEPKKFLHAFEMALKALEESDLRDQGCSHCKFEKYQMTRAEAKKGFLRGKSIFVSGFGESYEDMYLLRKASDKYCLITLTSRNRIEKKIKFCPCCGRELKE